MPSDDTGPTHALNCEAVYLLQAHGNCYRCKKKTTRMFALMALPPFVLEGEEFDVMDDDGPMLRELTNLPDNLVRQLRPIVGSMLRADDSRTAGLTYWMNHCEHCEAKQGDYFVQGPDGPFWPEDDAAFLAIEGVRLEGPFRLPDAITVYSGAMASWRDRRHGVKPSEKRKSKRPRL
jgi:hypothetical protein